jgi:WD40 repeat protein/energy-coupling factor transporter ATP-binding protein EcfA2
MQNHKLPAAIEDVASGPVDCLERALAVVDSSLRDKSSFESVSALRTAQARLSELRQREGDSPAVLDQIERFLQRGCAIGILLDNEDERWSVQSLLDYWANLLGRSERVRPEVTLAEFDPEQAPELPDEKCPYLGLNAFGEEDGPRFFGRSALIEDAIERLSRRRFLAVVGPSGSGKSSLVRAGILPRLRTLAAPGAEPWRISTMVPGSDPLAALSALKLEVEKAPPILLIVDQFEEVFTLCDKEADRCQFVDALLSLVNAQVAHRVILTVRSDFESYMAKYDALYELYGAGRVLITPLSAAELRDAIEKPAARVGLRFEAGVADNLLHDLLGEPAGLPLLQFTLLMMWERRQRNRITLEVYKRIGGGRKALSSSADEVYEAMIPQDQDTAKRLLLRLALAVDDRLEVTRSRMLRSKLYLRGEDPSRVDRVLQKLISARLLRLTPGPSAGEDQVEVAHEALVRNWRTLADWLQKARGALSERQRLESRAREWVRLGRGKSGLLDEVEAAEAARWLAQPEVAYLDPDPELGQLIQASRNAVAEAARQKEEARQRELELRTEREIERAAAQQKIAEVERKRADEQTAAARRAEKSRRAILWATAFLSVALLAALVATYVARARTLEARQLAAAVGLANAKIKEQLISSYVERGRQLLLVEQKPLEALPWLYRAKRAGSTDKLVSYGMRTALDSLAATKLLLVGHSDRVTSATYRPNGRHILTASDDKTARIWAADTGRLVAELAGHTASIYSTAYSPDGLRIVTAGADKTARVWDAEAGRFLFELKGHKDSVQSATYSPDGRRIVTTSVDKTARIWAADTGLHVTELKGHTDSVESATYSPNGRRIVTASEDNTARVWDADTGQHLLDLRGHKAGVNSVTYSPDGRFIATTSEDKTARIWEATTGRLVSVLAGHADAVLSGTYSPDGRSIVTASLDNTARIWAAETGYLLFELKGHGASVFSASYSPDGSQIVTVSKDNTARIWDAATGHLIYEFRGHGAGVLDAAYSPDGHRIVTASADKTARIWNSEKNRLLPELTGHTATVTSATYGPDGRHIITASFDNTARVWDAETGQFLFVLKGHTSSVLSAAYRPDGRRIVTASYDNTARVWNAENGQLLSTLEGHDSFVNSAAYSPNGQRIVTAGFDKTARVWDAETGRLLTVLKGHDSFVSSAEYNPSGSRIVTASFDKAARVWDAETGRLLTVLRGHADNVNSAAYSADGSRIVTSSTDKTARVWEAETGRFLFELKGHADSVNSARFIPKSPLIVTASFDKSARVWDAETGRAVMELKGHGDRVWSASYRPDGLRVVTAGLDSTARVWDVSQETRSADEIAKLMRCYLPLRFETEESTILGPAVPDPTACQRGL